MSQADVTEGKDRAKANNASAVGFVGREGKYCDL